jgi:hypothetical protein
MKWAAGFLLLVTIFTPFVRVTRQSYEYGWAIGLEFKLPELLRR